MQAQVQIREIRAAPVLVIILEISQEIYFLEGRPQSPGTLLEFIVKSWFFGTKNTQTH